LTAEPEVGVKATLAFPPAYAAQRHELPNRQRSTVSGRAVRFNRFR
jgi:hypothetical protein